MPASRPSRPSANKSRADTSPISKVRIKPQRVPRSSGSQRVKCLAWWCGKEFGRPADMRKHMDAKHLGYYWKCAYPDCTEVCAQKANLETHVKNVHTRELSSVCSCGHGFTDPSLLSRHRKATGHDRNPNAKRNYSGASVQCRLKEALDVTVELINNPSYIPKPFDVTFDRSASSSESPSSPLPQLGSSLHSRPSSKGSSETYTSSLFPPTPTLLNLDAFDLDVVALASPTRFSPSPEQLVLRLPNPEQSNLYQDIPYYGPHEMLFNSPLDEFSLVSDNFEWPQQHTVVAANIFSAPPGGVSPPIDSVPVQDFQFENTTNFVAVLRELAILDYQGENQIPFFKDGNDPSLGQISFYTDSPNIVTTMPAVESDFGFGELPLFTSLQSPSLLQQHQPEQKSQFYFAHDFD